MSLTITWKVGLLLPRFLIPMSPVKSNAFVLGRHCKSKWALHLIRYRNAVGDNLGVGFQNESDLDCCAVTLVNNIKVTSDEDGEKYLCIGNRHPFEPGAICLYRYLHGTEEMNKCRRNVTFVVTITMHSSFHPGMTDLEGLSGDMKHLLRSAFFSDLTVVTDDNAEFRTHKFVVCSRWKEIGSRINDTENVLRVTGVPGPVFKIFLKCLYTGKIKYHKITPELHDFVSRNCYDLKCSMWSLSAAQVSRTTPILEKKVLKWNVADSQSTPLSLFRVVHMNNIYTHEMIVALEASGEAPNLMLVISFPNCNAHRPILVCGDVSLEAESNGMTHQFSDVANSESDLEIALPFSTRELDSYQMTVTLDIADDYHQPVLESTETYFSTVLPGVYDLHSLKKDLQAAQKNEIYIDLKLITKAYENVLCHKALLGIRSETFRTALMGYDSPDDRVWKLSLLSVETETMLIVIKYIYTGLFLMLRGPRLVKVSRLARELRLHELHGFCEILRILPA